jgi:hypothetical protein
MSETGPANGPTAFSFERGFAIYLIFKGLPELRALEENLQVSSFDRARIHAMAESLKLNGLEQFLERMV